MDVPAAFSVARFGLIGELEGVKWVSTIVIGAILITGGVYIYLHRQQLEMGRLFGSPGAGQNFQPAGFTWPAVDRSSEGFKLEMPQNAREIEVPAYDQQGGTQQVAMICSYPDPSTSYSVSWADMPPVVRFAAESPEETLENARNGALARTQSVLVSEAQSTRQGFPARDFTGRNQGGGIFNARLILADRRLYLLMASFPAASARRVDDVNHFFDSFRIVSTAPKN